MVNDLFLRHAQRNQALILYVAGLENIIQIVLIKILRAILRCYRRAFIEYALVVLIGNAALLQRTRTPCKNRCRIIGSAQRVVNAAHAVLCGNESFSGLGRIISVFRFRCKCKPGNLPL